MCYREGGEAKTELIKEILGIGRTISVYIENTQRLMDGRKLLSMPGSYVKTLGWSKL